MSLSEFRQKASDIDIDKCFCCDRTCIHQYSRHMQNEYPTSLKVQRQQSLASLAVDKVTEVRQGFLNTWALAGNPSFRHWSPFLCCLMTCFANGPFNGGGLGCFF